MCRSSWTCYNSEPSRNEPHRWFLHTRPWSMLLQTPHPTGLPLWFSSALALLYEFLLFLQVLGNCLSFQEFPQHSRQLGHPFKVHTPLNMNLCRVFATLSNEVSFLPTRLWSKGIEILLYQNRGLMALPRTLYDSEVVLKCSKMLSNVAKKGKLMEFISGICWSLVSLELFKDRDHIWFVIVS